MPVVFSDEEISSVKARYPGLDLSGPGTIEGTLNMEAVFDGCILSDSFEVRITATSPNSDYVPALYEIGGRTKAIADKYGITDLRMLHFNIDGTACVCVKQMEKRKFPFGSELLVFVEELAVPYLYALSRFQESQQWPWGDYSHGALGLLEFAADDPNEQSEEDIEQIAATVRRDMCWKRYFKPLRKTASGNICPCGSGKKFNICHEKAYQGLIRLKADLKRFKLNPYKLFRPA